jgi:hypothetical protein
LGKGRKEGGMEEMLAFDCNRHMMHVPGSKPGRPCKLVASVGLATELTID